MCPSGPVPPERVVNAPRTLVCGNDTAASVGADEAEIHACLRLPEQAPAGTAERLDEHGLVALEDVWEETPDSDGR